MALAEVAAGWFRRAFGECGENVTTKQKQKYMTATWPRRGAKVGDGGDLTLNQYQKDYIERLPEHHREFAFSVAGGGAGTVAGAVDYDAASWSQTERAAIREALWELMQFGNKK